MYVVRQEARVSAGNGNAYRNRERRRGELAKSQEGFVSRLVLNSYGEPAKYAVLTTWTSREASRAFTLSAQLEAFLKADPLSAVATQTRPNEAYATIVDVVGSGEPASLTLVDWAIDNRPGNAAAFEASRKELFELAKKHTPGFVSSGLLRFLGAPNKYLAVRQSTNRDALPPAAPPEVQAYNAAHPATGFAATPNISERYEVIQRI